MQADYDGSKSAYSRLSCSPLCTVSFVLTPELANHCWLLVTLRVTDFSPVAHSPDFVITKAHRVCCVVFFSSFINIIITIIIIIFFCCIKSVTLILIIVIHLI